MMRTAPAVFLPAGFIGSLPHHEAGHAVAAMVLGLPCHGATVTGATGACALYAPLEPGEEQKPPAAPDFHAEVHKLAARVYLPQADERERSLIMCVILMAGRQAELIHAGLEIEGVLWGDDHDMQSARALLAPHFGAAPAAVYRCQRDARTLLLGNWLMVEEIAAALDRDGVWTRAQHVWDREAGHA